MNIALHIAEQCGDGMCPINLDKVMHATDGSVAVAAVWVDSLGKSLVMFHRSYPHVLFKCILAAGTRIVDCIEMQISKDAKPAFDAILRDLESAWGSKVIANIIVVQKSDLVNN